MPSFDAREYQQGAYRVMQQYVEARDGRALFTEEFEAIRRMVASISFTMERLPRLDELVDQASQNAFAVSELGLALEV